MSLVACNDIVLFKQIDKKMEDALRHTVKRSLQELSRTLNGDNKTEVVPVFTVAINLGKTNRVELKPTVQVSPRLLQPTAVHWTPKSSPAFANPPAVVDTGRNAAGDAYLELIAWVHPMHWPN